MQFLFPFKNGDRFPSKKGAVAAVLLAGCLSVLCAEVFFPEHPYSGSLTR